MLGVDRGVERILRALLRRAGVTLALVVGLALVRIGSISRVLATRLSKDVMTSPRGCPAAGFPLPAPCCLR